MKFRCNSGALNWKWSHIHTHREQPEQDSLKHISRLVCFCRPLIIYSIQSVDATAFAALKSRDREEALCASFQNSRPGIFWPAATTFAFPLNRVLAYIIYFVCITRAAHTNHLPYHLSIYTCTNMCSLSLSLLFFSYVLRQLDHLKCRLVFVDRLIR